MLFLSKGKAARCMNHLVCCMNLGLLKVDRASQSVLVHAEEKYSLWVFAKNEQCYGA